MTLSKIPQSMAMGKEYQEADLIIKFLTEPDDESNTLSETLKNKLLLLKEVHGYRLRYKRKLAIVKLLQMSHPEINEQRAYYLIRECEYVFGAVNNVSKDYERQFILECSRRNIEFAMKSKNPKHITSALQAHYEFCGLSKENIDLPDFSKLEQHNYILSLPEQYMKVIQNLISSGVVNLNDLQIQPTINIPSDDSGNTEQ